MKLNDTTIAILGVVGGVVLAGCGYFTSLYAQQDDERLLHDDADNTPAYDEKLRECTEQIELFNADINEVCAARRQALFDVMANNNALRSFLETRPYQYTSLKDEPSQSDRMLEGVSDRLNDLLKSYPHFPSDAATLENLTTFHTLNATHHAEVMNLIHIELPETYEKINSTRAQLKIHTSI